MPLSSCLGLREVPLGRLLRLSPGVTSTRTTFAAVRYLGCGVVAVTVLIVVDVSCVTTVVGDLLLDAHIRSVWTRGVQRCRTSMLSLNIE